MDWSSKRGLARFNCTPLRPTDLKTTQNNLSKKSKAIIKKPPPSAKQHSSLLTSRRLHSSHKTSKSLSSERLKRHNINPNKMPVHNFPLLQDSKIKRNPLKRIPNRRMALSIRTNSTIRLRLPNRKYRRFPPSL